MPITQPRLDDLDRLAAAVVRVQVNSGHAQLMAGHSPDRAVEFSREAFKECGAMLETLSNMGARIPGPEGIEPRPGAPLHLLNTPKVRKFIAILEAAAAAGREVDEERGNVEDGESFGIGEHLADMALRYRMEAYGPDGRD